MKYTFYPIAFLLFFSLCLQAQPQRVRATPQPIHIAQPNGDSLVVLLHGSEYGHFHTTEDAYKIQKNTKGYFCYVKTKKNGEEKLTCRKAHNVVDRKWCERRFLRKQKRK